MILAGTSIPSLKNLLSLVRTPSETVKVVILAVSSFLMSKSSANSLVYFSKKDFRFKPFLKQIIQGQINSGIAMSLAGTSRPCSGSEHLISHAIDNLNIGLSISGSNPVKKKAEKPIITVKNVFIE